MKRTDLTVGETYWYRQRWSAGRKAVYLGLNPNPRTGKPEPLFAVAHPATDDWAPVRGVRLQDVHSTYVQHLAKAAELRREREARDARVSALYAANAADARAVLSLPGMSRYRTSIWRDDPKNFEKYCVAPLAVGNRVELTLDDIRHLVQAVKDGQLDLSPPPASEGGSEETKR